MAIVTPTVKISTPTEPILPGRGFYQLEEDILYVQIGPFFGGRRFFSYLENDQMSLCFDKEGRLIFIEIYEARRHWDITADFAVPGVIEPADIRWLDFRTELSRKPQFLTDKRRTMLALQFKPCQSGRNFYLADHVLAQIDDENQVCSIWIDDITDDLAGQEIAAFRKRLRKNSVTIR